MIKACSKVFKVCLEVVECVSSYEVVDVLEMLKWFSKGLEGCSKGAPG